MLTAAPSSYRLSLQVEGSGAYQKLGSPQRGELDGREAIITGFACRKPQEEPLGLQRGMGKTRSPC